MPSVLDRLEALNEGATEGPWLISDSEYIWVCTKDGREVIQDSCWVGPEEDPHAWEDAALIAAARNALPDLLAVAKALEESHERLCGCDQPGHITLCVAGEEWAALAPLVREVEA